MPRFPWFLSVLLAAGLLLPTSAAASVARGGYALLALTPNDPGWPQQEEMRRIEADKAWDLTTGRPEIIVAVLDSGVSTTHVDLAGKVLPGRNFVTGKPGQVDDEGHGTMTASVAAGLGNNGGGMAGVCWACRVMPLKVFNRDDTSDSAFVDAIRYAADNGARVINISAGGLNPSASIEEAVNYASDKGMLVVVSAGNTPDNLPLYPAAYERVLAVAASGLDDNVTGFSTYADWVDIAAPGINVTGADYKSKTDLARASGTSFSAPLVAGAAALLLSLRPELTADQVRALLLDTAVDIGPFGRDNNFGAGRLSVFDAALVAARPAPTGDATAQAASNGAQVQLAATGFAAGERLRAWLTGAGGRVIVVRGLSANANGGLTHAASLTTDSPPGPYLLTVMGEQSRRVAGASVAGPGSAPTAAGGAQRAFQPIPSTAAPSGSRYFSDTSHSLGGVFRAYWEANGGLAIFGYPLSEEFEELNRSDNQTYRVQYFERNRFEHHPRNQGTPYEVQLGLLGVLLMGEGAFPPGSPTPTTATNRFFQETRHSLSDEFLRYWEANGADAIFGFPTSEPLTENGRRIQYFQRNRFEFHPDDAAGQPVKLGLLGTDLARRNGYLP